MIEPCSWTSGDQKNFAITLTFAPDPDRGGGASPPMSATWGSFEIWVNGLNLCMHREDSVTLPAVHWYLLPLLRWFVINWDALLHEERLPNRNEGRDAWLSLRATNDPPPALPEQQMNQWEELQHAWWTRHALLACREGGLFPNVVIRRMRDKIEFSWGPSVTAGTPQHYYFFANHGYARIDPQTVARHLSSVIGSAIQHLCSEEVDEPVFEDLSTKFQNIQNVDRLEHQIGLICGLQNGIGNVARARKALDSQWLAPFVTEKRSKLVVVDSPQFCLMFGSVAPDISQLDIERLTTLMNAIPHPYQENELLRNVVRDEPIRSALERPWNRGYELAEELRQALPESYRDGSLVDIETLFTDLEIEITAVQLDDLSIRAVAIAGENCRPTVAINTRYRFQHLHPRRFTLAHELCHLLHDRTHGVRLALASGPWTPVDVEKRANAFAAMFLMPPDVIQEIVIANKIDIESVQGLWAISSRLGVSFSAIIEHLCNLGFIDAETRDDLKQQAIQNMTVKTPQ